MTLPAYLSGDGDSTLVRVRLQPRGRRDEIAGERDGALVVRVSAPPVEGRANAALCKLLAKTAGVAPSRAELVRGASSREKVVRLDGVDPGTAAARLR